MRNFILLLILATICVANSHAQTGPVCTFNYQAVVRDGTDAVIPDRNISVRLSVLDGPGGTALYIETHTTTTNSLGLFTLEVGAGTRTGGTLDWMAIPWLVNRHYLKVEADINGGQAYELLGEAPVLAVPIAIQAKFASLAYQTIDTITKVVQTLCADTLKSKIACLDTIKSFKTYIDELCVDTIPGLVYIEKITGDTACFDYTKTHEGIIDHLEVDSTIYVFRGGNFIFWVDPSHEVFTTDAGVNGSFYADTLHAHKAFVDSICAGNVMTATSQVKEELIAGHVFVDSSLYVSDGQGGNIFWVDPSKQIFTSEAGVVGEFYADTVESIVSRTQKLYAGQICAEDIIGERYMVLDPATGILRQLANFSEGRTEVFGNLISGQQAEIDTLRAKKIYSDNFCTNVIMTESIVLAGPNDTSLMVAAGDGHSIGSIDKLFSESVCTQDLLVENVFLFDSASGPHTVMLLHGDGSTELAVDKVFAESVCTKDFLIQYPDNTPMLEIHPDADPLTEYGFIFNHNIMVNGGIMAEFKQFVIDHPLDPENKTLRHFSIESDRMLNVYSGTATFNKKGEAWVQLPEWFEALNTDFTYQLTCIGGFANVYIADEITNNRFRIAGGNSKLKVSWQVSGVRHDKQALAVDLPVEAWKTNR